jgi:hypothetical protein
MEADIDQNSQTDAKIAIVLTATNVPSAWAIDSIAIAPSMAKE